MNSPNTSSKNGVPKSPLESQRFLLSPLLTRSFGEFQRVLDSAESFAPPSREIVASLAVSIGLDELAIAPERAADLSDEDRRVLRYRIEAVRAALDLDMPAPSNGNGNGAPRIEGDFTVDQAAAAKMLGVSVSYLEHHRELPIFVKQGRKVMVSNQALQNYIKTLRAQRR